MCLTGDKNNPHENRDTWINWAEESKSIAGEHISLKMKALRDYRSKGLFSYRNLKHYFSTVIELDKVYTKAYFDAWVKASRVHRVESLRQEWQKEVDLLNGETAAGN